MERQEPSSEEVERLKKEIARLQARIIQLSGDLERMRQQHIKVWGEA